MKNLSLLILLLFAVSAWAQDTKRINCKTTNLDSEKRICAQLTGGPTEIVCCGACYDESSGKLISPEGFDSEEGGSGTLESSS